MVHELLPLELLLLLLETPSDDGVEVAVDFLKEVRGEGGRLVQAMLFGLFGSGKNPSRSHVWLTVGSLQAKLR